MSKSKGGGCAVVALAALIGVLLAILIMGTNSLDADLSRGEWCRAHGNGLITRGDDGTYYCAQDDSPIPIPIPDWVGSDW